ncbi:hypothetical protein TSUD_111160 [Trifolium subterraneum]|uniref:Pentacotripeptide-repeat region of PRORP domain-containing protein n=1 Tax=Trifolium subterraneum TaxID=3900 RepID=A0A2Z6LT35_TRISU|nr:hypothetical protein TSUD_111160 [Trifolium subterraneum]
MAEEMFNRVVEKGLKPDTRLFNEMIGAYFQVGNTEKAMDVYRSMKDSGCFPDELTFTILIRNLLKNEEHELVETLKKESFDYVNAPDKFVQKVQQKHLYFGITPYMLHGKAKKEAYQAGYIIPAVDEVLLYWFYCRDATFGD